MEYWLRFHLIVAKFQRKQQCKVGDENIVKQPTLILIHVWFFVSYMQLKVYMHMCVYACSTL